MADPAKLDEYRQQLAQVEAAIANDPENPEWTKLRDDLVEVIELTSELAESKASAAASSSELKSYAVGERCQAIYEQDGQWYNAKVVALGEDGYFVTYLGFGNTAQVRAGRGAAPVCLAWAVNRPVAECGTCIQPSHPPLRWISTRFGRTCAPTRACGWLGSSALRCTPATAGGTMAPSPRCALARHWSVSRARRRAPRWSLTL